MTSLLGRARPAVIFEMAPAVARLTGLELTGTWNFLEARRYDFFRTDDCGQLQRLDAPPPGEDIFVNVVAVPRDHLEAGAVP